MWGNECIGFTFCSFENVKNPPLRKEKEKEKKTWAEE